MVTAPPRPTENELTVQQYDSLENEGFIVPCDHEELCMNHVLLGELRETPRCKPCGGEHQIVVLRTMNNPGREEPIYYATLEDGEY